jgi:fumarate reductase subunit C
MKHARAHPAYHSQWYRPRMSTYWWLERAAYLKFILRELTSVFVGWFVVVMLMLICALGRGPAAYQEFQQWLQSPLLVAVNVVALLFVLYHSLTWFSLAAAAMVVRVGGKRVPDLAISGGNYFAWVVASAAVAWLILGA